MSLITENDFSTRVFWFINKTIMKMKKLLRFALLIFLVFVYANTQAQVKFGPIVGLNLSTATMEIDGEDWPMDNMLVGYHFGVVSEIPLIKNLSLQPGIIYSLKGYAYRMSLDFLGMHWDLKRTINVNYIEIPVNAVYCFGLGPVKISLLAGPYLAFAVSGVSIFFNETDNKLTHNKMTFGSGENDFQKAFDFGVNGGAGVNFRGLLISGQYGFGLANIASESSVKSSNSIVKNRVIGISLSYLF